MIAQHIDLRAGDTELNRTSDGRADLQQLHEYVDAGKLRFGQFNQFRAQTVTRFDARCLDHDLPDIRACRQNFVRQDETRRAAPHVGRPEQHVLIALQRLFKPVHLGPRFGDRGILRQGEIDQQFGPVRGREKLVLDELHRPDRRAERGQRDGDGHPAESHRRAQHPVEHAPHPPRPCLVMFHFRRQKRHAQQRRKQHRHDPAHQQRHGNHYEKRKGEFPRRRVVQTDRDETGHRHQRAREHREGNRGPRETRRLGQGLADLKP